MLILLTMEPSIRISQVAFSHLRRACSPAASQVPLTLGLLTVKIVKAKLQAILPAKIGRSFLKRKIYF